MTEAEQKILENQAQIMDALGRLLSIGGDPLPGKMFKAADETREIVRATAMLKGDK